MNQRSGSAGIIRSAILAGFLLTIVLFCASCVTVRYEENATVAAEDIRELQRRLVTNPDDVDALRDLGVLYFRTRNYQQAQQYLERAASANTQDAKTLFYLGMTNESLGERNRALALYSDYTEFSPLSPYRGLMEGRYRGLTLEIIREQFHTLVQQESQLGERRALPNTVAVFPLVFQGGDPRYSALGLGLSEMMIIDLGQVKQLRVVERIRIDALLDELRFGESKAVDPATAPRLGRLLTAGRIVSGAYSVSTDRSLRTDVAYYDVAAQRFPAPVTLSDGLDNLFALQKDIVLDVVKRMGITLTSLERENILRMPTRNLQAFIAYSIGLEKEDQGDFTAAAVYYRQAVTLDPGFGPAKSRAQASEALSLAGGSQEQAYASAQRLDPPLRAQGTGGTRELLNSRLGRLGEGIESGFVPGQDNRKGPESAATGGGAVGRLADPPSPPQ